MGNISLGFFDSLRMKMLFGAVFLIYWFLFFSCCRTKGEWSTTPSKSNLTCMDSVFFDIKSADQCKDCVKALNLVEEGLTKFPFNVLEYKNITALNLEMNSIDSIPEEICKLTKLTSLIFAYGTVKHLPACIGSLKDLRNLDLLDNELESLPETIGNLRSLERLNLKGNKITTLPKSIINLKKLHFLAVADEEGVCHLSIKEQEFIIANLPNCKTNFGPERE